MKSRRVERADRRKERLHEIDRKKRERDSDADNAVDEMVRLNLEQHGP